MLGGTLAVLFLFHWLYNICVAQPNCSNTGLWGEWEPWQPCSNNPSGLNFSWRKRYCLGQPPGCTVVSEYTCLGSYAQLEECNATTSTTAMTGTATVTAVTEHTNSCGNTCSNLHISNVTFFNTTLGTITTNYYIASDGCRYLEMTCSAMDGQDVLLGANGNLSSIVTTGVPSATLNMTCGVDSMWFLSNSSNEVIHSLSCLSVPRLNQTNGNATTNSTSSPTVTTMNTTHGNSTVPSITTTTTKALGTTTPAPPCLSCPRLKPSDSPKNVFITLDHGIKNNCSTVSVSCSSSQPGGTVVLVVNGISSNHSTIANLSCTCSPQNIWLDNATGQQVKTVICLRYFPETTVPTTPIPTTTAAPGSPCTNCSNLKSVYTANMSAGAIEGRLVLDHYISRTGCRSVDIQCSSETGGQRAAIIFNGNVSNPYAVATTSVVTTLYCNSKSQWTNRNGTFIANNVTCILLPATNTTTNVTTTPTPILSTTATTPSCTACPPMRIGWVNDSMKMNGMVVMDRSTLNGCDVLQLSCYSDRVYSAVDILDSFGLPLAAGIGVVNTTFLCSNSAQWLSLVGYDVEQILCITPKVATTTPAPTSTTTVLTTTTAAPNATCRKCTTLLPIRVNNTMQNGNMLIEQFIASNGCKGATVRCFGSNNSQAEISFNGNYKDPTVVGRGNIFAMVMCSSRATWFFYNASVENFTSASCVLKPIASDNVTTSPVPTTPARPSTTTSPPGTPNCTKCGMPTIGNVTLPGFKEGNTVIDTTTVQGCAQTIITCLNDVPTLSVRILSIENGTLASGIGSANVTLACNHASRWQMANGTLVPGFICAIEVAMQTTTHPPTTITTRATTAITALTTTTVAAKCQGTQWNQWNSWTECSDTCGACGTRQRFRGCLQTSSDCECPGSAYDKTVCNTLVCTYPRASCCEGFAMGSSNNQFECIRL